MPQTLNPADLKTEIVPITAVKLHPDNARRGDLDLIKRSLTLHGQYRTIVVQRSTGHALAGNHTLQAMQDLNYEQIAVGYVDVDDEQAREILAIDNRASDEASYDDQALLTLLQKIAEQSTASERGLTAAGYDDDLLELRRLTGQLGHDQSSFLDDLRSTANSEENRNHFQLQFPVTQEQRNTVNRALKKIQTERELESSTEALLALAADVLADK